jgi:hypothetical protein
MLPIDCATLAIIATFADCRVLATPERDAFRIEPNAGEHEIARPIAELFFGQSDAVVPVTDEALVAVLAARGTLPKAEPKTDEEVLAEFNKLADELAAVQAAAADLHEKNVALEAAHVGDAAVIAKLEIDLGDARSRIPVVAPHDGDTPPVGSSAI